MKLDMVMKLLPEQLSSYKKNIIQPMIDNVPIGEVVAVRDDYGDGYYNCIVEVYPESEMKVLDAMTQEAEKLKR